MKSYTVHLIRHGTTAGNEEGRYIGSTDLPLSAGGTDALRRLRRAHPYPEAQTYFSSPMKRCIQTLGVLYTGAKPILVSDLRECSFGDWEGKTAGEIAEEDDRFRRWVSGGGEPITPPNGEDGGAFARRVCAAFEKIVEGLMRSGVTSAAVVAHGGTIMAILSAYGLPRAEFYEWMTQPGHGYSMRITPGLWMRSKVGEVYARIPAGRESRPEKDEKLIIDLAREAADRAYGRQKDEAAGEEEETDG